MRIIKKGIKPEPVKKIFTCKKCDCIFEASSNDGLRMIETTDHFFYTTIRQFVPVACPNCGKLHRVYID